MSKKVISIEKYYIPCPVETINTISDFYIINDRAIRFIRMRDGGFGWEVILLHDQKMISRQGLGASATKLLLSFLLTTQTQPLPIIKVQPYNHAEACKKQKKDKHHDS